MFITTMRILVLPHCTGERERERERERDEREMRERERERETGDGQSYVISSEHISVTEHATTELITTFCSE